MHPSYETLPLSNPTAPKVLSHRNRSGNPASQENILQDSGDAMTILGLAGLSADLCSENIIAAKEKFMVETQPMNTSAGYSESLNTGTSTKGARKPHYTRLLVFHNCLVFQAACCLPLKVIAASLDGMPVSGRIMFNSYSEKEGGKLVYEFKGKGVEMIVDLKRGESTRAQRLIFSLIV